MENMAEKLGLGNEVRQLKIGQSFTDPKSSAFHSIKYDFKPASVDTNKIATVDVGSNHQVTVTVPHLDGAGVPQTVFKGSQRLYQKECVLIIDRVTGEITLEKLACNIQVKKTRSESTKASNNNASDRSNLTSRSQTPPITQVTQRISHKTKVTSGSRRADRQITHLVPKHSPLHASPNYPSPGHHNNNNNNKSPKRDNHENHPSTLASLPMIGIDDFDQPSIVPTPSTTLQSNSNQMIATTSQINEKSPNFPLSDDDHNDNDDVDHTIIRDNHLQNGNVIGEITDTSSSSSDSDSDTDPDNTVIDKRKFNSNNNSNSNNNNNNNSGSSSNNNNNNKIQQNGHTNSGEKLPTQLLNEDLCLSESGSDSD